MALFFRDPSTVCFVCCCMLIARSSDFGFATKYFRLDIRFSRLANIISENININKFHKNNLNLEVQICSSSKHTTVSLYIHYFSLQFQIYFFFYVGALYLVFNGSYRVKHILSNKLSTPNEKYAFRIQTKQKNALLFYARGPNNYNDFMQIEINDARIKLKVNFGADGTYGYVIGLCIFSLIYITVHTLV